MPKRFATAFAVLRESLWLIPSIAVIVAVVGAEAMVWLSTKTTLGWLPLVFSGGANAAQGLLQAIAASVITVAGVTFSVTIIALQLTSTQFSPRVLRNFIRDRINQSVLATFLGTFAYCVMVLGSIRSASDGLAAFVPVPAVAGAVVLTLLSLGMLAYFIHHIAHTIQVSAITDSVSREARSTLAELWAADRDSGDATQKRLERGAPARAPSDEECVLAARESGYLVYAAHERLVALAAEADAVLRVHPRPGEWVSTGRPLVSVAPPAARHRLRRDPRDELDLGPQPTLQQDVAFGVRQLVDIALKALSPSLNDPTTAVNCVDRLNDLLLDAGRREEPARARTDPSGTVRLIAPLHDFSDLVGLAFDQLRHFGGDRLYVSLAMAEGFRTLVEELPPRRHAVVQRQARLLAHAVQRIEPEGDRHKVVDALLRVVDLPE